MFFALWVVPFFVWFPMITRIRNIAEHAVVPDNDDPFRNARTTKANWLWRAAVAPYWVNYHVEHHLLMCVPCYNLPKLHALVDGQGIWAEDGTAAGLPDGACDLRRRSPRGGEQQRRRRPVETGNNHGAGIAFNITPRAGKRA